MLKPLNGGNTAKKERTKIIIINEILEGKYNKKTNFGEGEAEKTGRILEKKTEKSIERTKKKKKNRGYKRFRKVETHLRRLFCRMPATADEV